MVKKICQTCGKEFEGKNISKYCCRKCYTDSKKRPVAVVCPVCGKIFYTVASIIRQGRGKHCSPECQRKARINDNYYVEHDTYTELMVQYKTEYVSVFIDKEDVEKVKQISWCLSREKSIDKFYVISRVGLKNKTIYLHRYIMDCPEEMVVDHINHNPLDNRKDNLRVCNQWGNNQNSNRNTSGYVGVRWEEDRKKWVARITYKGYVRTIGRYKELQDAINARKQAEEEYGLIQTYKLNN